MPHAGMWHIETLRLAQSAIPGTGVTTGLTTE
jgi:hypothetical protein